MNYSEDDMKLFQMYKHYNGRDVALVPVSIISINENSIKYKVKWYNVVDRIYFIDNDEVEIRNCDFKDWKIIND